MALTVKSRRARSSSSVSPKVTRRAVGDRRRCRRAGKWSPRGGRRRARSPSRSGSRSGRPGRAQDAFGAGVGSHVPVDRRRRGAGRARSRRPGTRRGRRRAAWGNRRTPAGIAVAGTRAGVAGAAARASRRRRLRRPSVRAEEEIVAPGFVARVGEVRGEERVHVAAWLEGRTQQAHARLFGQAAALAVVAALQAVTRLSQVWHPPRWRGMTWSSVRSWPWRPQYWQVWLSRAKISRRERRTRGRGRRMRCWSRMTEGARKRRAAYGSSGGRTRRPPPSRRRRAGMRADVADVEWLVVLVEHEYDAVHAGRIVAGGGRRPAATRPRPCRQGRLGGRASVQSAVSGRRHQPAPSATRSRAARRPAR